MIKRDTILYYFLSLSLGTLSLAQDLDKIPLKEKALTQNQILKKASKISNQDLSALKHPEKPMLWKIEGNGLKKTSYLFGSVHVADTNITKLHPDVEAAYQQADTLATEINLGLINQLRAVKLMMRDDDKTLQEVIGEEIYTELNQQLAEIDPSLTAEPFNEMKTWAVYLAYSMIEEQMKGGKALDLVLWERAAKDDKDRWAIETIKEQMGGIDTLSDHEQTTILKDSLLITKKFKQHQFNALSLIKNLYLKGDTQELLILFDLFTQIEGTNLKIGKKFEQLILYDRNHRMAATINEKLNASPDQSHFIVAGTMHYIGNKNIVKLLRKKGYIVTFQQK